VPGSRSAVWRYKGGVKATLLGTSSAWPLPRPGCHCVQCEEAREFPALRRTRSALHLAGESGGWLVDTPPDLLFQLERESLSPDVEAVVITHHHLDHVLGLDDLCQVRSTEAGPLPVHTGSRTQGLIRAIFPHLLSKEPPRIRFCDWVLGSRLTWGDTQLTGFETNHRAEAETTAVLLETTHAGRGIRIAYATDMGTIEPQPRSLLSGVDLFVGDGTYLGESGHGHPGTAAMLRMTARLGAAQVAVTHVGHWGVSSAVAQAELGVDVAICRDGDGLLSFLP
jgi:phosphoribosyl 1,2-cyclic phosphate phosphodiesterase